MRLFCLSAVLWLSDIAFQSFLHGRDAKASDFIEELIYKQEPMAAALRLMCLSRCIIKPSYCMLALVNLFLPPHSSHSASPPRPQMLHFVTRCQCYKRRPEKARFLQARAGSVVRARCFACCVESREGRIAAQGCQGLVAVNEEGESHPPCLGAHTCMMR